MTKGYNQIRVLIIDNNVELCKLLNEAICREEDMKVVGIAYDGLQGLEMIPETEPDIILLDVVMPRLDGMGVLCELSSRRLSRRPRIMMLTVMGTYDMMQKFRDYGADSCVVKPFDIYELLDRIRRLCRDVKEETASEADRDRLNDELMEYLSDGEAGVERAIGEILYVLGVPTHRRGYLYLREAILLATKDPERLIAVTTLIFPTVAEKFSTTPAAVQTVIRSTIRSIWKNTDRRRLRDVFGLDVMERCFDEPPSNGEFIARVVETLQMVSRRGKGKIFS